MTNLIEQLGGYSMSHAYHESLSDGATACVIGNTIHSKESLGLSLLEYRRQHNIFEEGDLVTHLTTRAILRVVSAEDSNTHYRFIKVEALNPKNDGSVSDCFNSLWFQLKHATDEEIKAGKRLSIV